MISTILKHKQYRNWSDLERKIELLSTMKQRGDVFEDFVYAYFSINRSLYQIERLFKINEVPSKIRKQFKLERTDSGIDGILILENGRIAAYQAKFRSNRTKPTYDELAKFWAEARHVDYHYTIANAYSLSKLCLKNNKHIGILVDEFERLDRNFFKQLYEFANNRKPKKLFYKPDKFQNRMINNVVKGFKNNNRGKMIAACGTGKTLTALWITEALKARKALFIVPSLALIKQTLEVWADQTKKELSYICVCSDRTVAEAVDDWDINTANLGVPVTTQPDQVAEYLAKLPKELNIVFSTYQSLDVLAEALKGLDEFKFDLTIFDEAHRTAGAKSSQTFSLALHDEYITSRKRLFMTATERLVRPWVIKKAKEHNRVVFSMDDVKLYGPVFDRLSFGEAIQNHLISDYKIIIAGVRQKEIYDWIRDNKLLVDMAAGTAEFHTSAHNLFRQVMLCKSMHQYPIKKTITFHSTIAQARAFIKSYGKNDLILSNVFKLLWPNLKKDELYLDHINGSMGAGNRTEILDNFRDSKYGIVSNSRCLTEGVDVPIIDSVYFVNPKHSLIDIVQACGRALRKSRNKLNKTAYFIIPILIPDDEISSDALNKINFEMLHNLIQSLRDQDQRMEDWIDKINLYASRRGGTGHPPPTGNGPIILDIPQEFNIREFEQHLYLKIAEVNAEPTTYKPKTIKYGKTERKSTYKRIFKTLGDYSVKSYRKSLVMPTVHKYSDPNQVLSKRQLAINHNNISHTERLGIIIKSGNSYKLTPLGRQLYFDDTTFENVFAGQMLRYYSIAKDKSTSRILFPYRTCLKILKDVKSINFLAFVFGIYTMIDSSDESISESIEIIKYIQGNYPNPSLLNITNKTKVLEHLNKKYDMSFESKEIWHKKTTIGNQFIYFRDHLSLFGDIIKTDKNSIYIIPGMESKIERLLKQNSELEKSRSLDQLKKRYIETLVILFLIQLTQ